MKKVVSGTLMMVGLIIAQWEAPTLIAQAVISGIGVAIMIVGLIMA
jgi:hypothetical protein